MTDDLGRLRDWLSLAQSRTDWNQFGAIFKKINKELKQHLELAHSRKNNSRLLPLIDLDFEISLSYVFSASSPCPKLLARRKHPVLMIAKNLSIYQDD
jgi:hypothetical protein